MTARTQTTYTFSDKTAALTFRTWLKFNEGDSDYGVPKFLDMRQVSTTEWCVEYQFDTRNQLARGVAIGIEQAAIWSPAVATFRRRNQS